MIELDYFKSKLIGYLKEHTSERIENGEWIEIVSDTAYDDMNHLIQGGLTRSAAQEMALSQMLSKVPESLYERIDAIYEARFNQVLNSEGLPLINRLGRHDTILTLMDKWPDNEGLSNDERIQLVSTLVKEANDGVQ